MAQTIKLQSSDKKIIEVDIGIAKCSTLIRTMLEFAEIEDGEDGVVPLPNVNTVTLEKVISWATRHKDDPVQAEGDDGYVAKTAEINKWDAEFVKVDHGTLFDLILAANYLDIKGLLDLTCKAVSKLIIGKSPEEIRKTFNIINDFTEAEEEQIRNENDWVEEKY